MRPYHSYYNIKYIIVLLIDGYPSLYLYLSMVSIYLGIKPERLQCHVCEKTLCSANALKVHIESVHEGSIYLYLTTYFYLSIYLTIFL